MKTPLIIICSILFVFFLIGMIVWPFMASLTEWQVYPFPLSLAIISFFLILIFHFNKSELLVCIFTSVLVCNLIEAAFCALRYEGKFYKNAIVIHALWGNKRGLANPFGIPILSPNYDSVLLGQYDNGLVILRNGDEKALYSVGQKSIVMPFGQSLLTYGKVYEDHSLYGITTKHGDMIVEPKYEKIEQLSESYIVKYNNKYGALTNLGVINIKPEYDWYYGVIDLEDEYYFIFRKENLNYLFKQNAYTPYMKTKYEIKKIVTPNRFLVRNTDYKDGIIDRDGNIIIGVEYDYLNCDLVNNTFECRKYHQDWITYDFNGKIIKGEIH